MKQNFKILSIILVAIMVIALPGCSGNNDQFKVKTSVAKTAQLESIFAITGALIPVQAADLSAPFTSKVLEILVASGDTVKQGQVIARLDDTQLNAQLQQSTSSYQQMKRNQAQAKINLDSALTTLNRTKYLYGEGAAAKVQVDADQKAYDLAKNQYDSGASVSAAKASVDSINVQIANASIKSPFDGIVLNENIGVGETASMGSTLFSVGDMSILKLKGTVSQEALPYIKNGDPVELFIDIYPDKTFIGKIDSIGAMSVSTGSYFPVEISLINADKLVSGLSAHADIKVTGEKHVIVPRSSIVENKGESYLFVIVDGIATKKTVITGLRNDSEIEIIKGLSGTETVAITNANNLFDAMPVQIVKE